MIRILSSRTALVDKSGMIMPDWFTFISDWARQFNKRTFSSSGAFASVTGTTDSTSAASVNVTVGVTGSLRLTVNTTTTSNANAKTIVVKAGSVIVQTVSVTNNTASQSFTFYLSGRAANSQYSAITSQINCTGTAGVVAADLSGNTQISIMLQLANSADSIALESYALEVEAS